MNTQQMLKCGPLIKPNFLFSILSNASATSWASSSLGNMTLSTSVSIIPYSLKWSCSLAPCAVIAFVRAFFPASHGKYEETCQASSWNMTFWQCNLLFESFNFFGLFTIIVTSIAESRTSVKKKKKMPLRLHIYHYWIGQQVTTWILIGK